MTGTSEVQALARELAAVKARLAQVEGALQRLLAQQEPSEAETPAKEPARKVTHVQKK